MPSREGTDPVSARSATDVDDGDGEHLIGRVIDGRYRLESTIGRGGMGLVFRGHHVGLRRYVAVKILHPSVAASPDVRNRFEREALASGKIDHPNCIAVYDTGRLPDGSLYLAMELLDGRSLADVLETEGQLAPGRALHILAHILRGLAHIHQAGLIHRDIKPENVFLIRQGDDVDFAKILDFGIAKPLDKSDLDDGVKLTQAGMAFGTPIYMAPEQALGAAMDGRADVYAAAVMGYEMLCGQPPFYSDDKLEVMSMHTARPVPPMRQRLIKNARPVPSSIERVIVKGLTKKPSERYPSAEEFLAAVEAALATKDGDATEIEFEKVTTTGSTPLVAEGDQITVDKEWSDEERSESIAAAIDETLGDEVPRRPSTLSGPPPSPRSARPPSSPSPPSPSGLPPGVAAGTRLSASRLPQGGVGLGLPYTGPSGEPIFGLTPEQRHAQAGIANVVEPGTSAHVRKARRPRSLLIGIAAIAIAVGVAIAIATTRTSAPSHDLDPSSPAGQAMAALEHGDPAKAIEILGSFGAAVATDANAQLVLGHAHAARRSNWPAFDAYARALELSPALETNAALRANLRAMAADREITVAARALELWVGRTRDPQAKPALVNAAISEDAVRRHGVREVVEKLGLLGEVDLLISYSYDLDQGETCEKRQDAVSKLRALEDPRAVPALERAIARKIKTGPTRGKAYSPCLVEDAKAAIGFLRGLASSPRR